MKRLAKKTLLIGSGKGGVGKSTVSVNLAIAAAQKTGSVALFDADLYGPSVPLMLGLRELGPQTRQDGKVIPITKFNLHTLSLGFFIEENRSIPWRGPMLQKMLTQMLEQVAWPELDLLFVDLPPGTGDIPIALKQLIAIDGAYLVTTPQEIAMIDVLKATHMFDQLEIPVLGLIENMSGSIFGENKGEGFAQKLGVPFLGTIPLCEKINAATNEGHPFALHPTQDSYFQNILNQVV